MGSVSGGGGSSKSTSTSTSVVPRAPASPQEAMLGQIAAEQYADYVNRFQPLNQQLLDRVHVKVGRDVIPTTARAGVDVRLAMQGKKPDMLRDGVSAGSGRAIMGNADYDRAVGEAVGDAQGGAYRGAYDQEFTGLQKMAAQGRDIQDASVVSMAEAGRRATEAAIAKAGRNVSKSGTENVNRPADYSSSIAALSGAVGNGLASYLFKPNPFGNSTTGEGLYNAGGYIYDFPGMSTGSGGLLGSIGDGLSSIGSSIGSSVGGIFDGGSSGGWTSGMFTH